MGRRGSETGLRWALAAALLLHAAALATAARLPSSLGTAGGLEEIQVFDASASTVITPVTLVELPAAAQRPREASDESSAAPAPTAETVVAALRPPARSHAGAAPRAQRSASSRPGPRRAGVAPARPGLPEAGGGGGGPLALAPPSPSGTFTAPSGGGTELGQAPGQGSGSGSGEGAGSGGGSGRGSGGGEGAGTGGGKASGGEGSGEAAPRFVSRLADRAEPEVIRKGQLRYPEAAVADGAEGTCVLKVLVGETGEVIAAEVTRSSGDRRLDKAALDFVRQWRYRPAVQEGKPRQVSTRATVQFELN